METLSCLCVVNELLQCFVGQPNTSTGPFSRLYVGVFSWTIIESDDMCAHSGRPSQCRGQLVAWLECCSCPVVSVCKRDGAFKARKGSILELELLGKVPLHW